MWQQQMVGKKKKKKGFDYEPKNGINLGQYMGQQQVKDGLGSEATFYYMTFLFFLKSNLQK
jgi:hypothetical protein